MPIYNYRTTKVAKTLAVTVLVIIYSVGLASENWVVVHEYQYIGKVKAHMGLFKACGYDLDLQVKGKKDADGFPKWFSDDASDEECFSLFESGVPEWVRAVQFFAVLSMFLLCCLDILWIFTSICGDLTENKYRIPIIVLWVLTGILMLVHPIIFAYYIRPTTERRYSNEDDPIARKEVVTTTMYWGPFFLHCIVAGAMNFLALMVLACVCCCKFCDCD